MPKNTSKISSAGRYFGRASKKYRSKSLSPQRDNLNHPVEVYAWARTKSSANWRRILRFTDRDGADRIVAAVNSQIRTGSLLCDFLEDHGFPVPPAEETRQRLTRSILEAQPSRRLLLVERPGWHGSQFLLGTNALGDGPESLMLRGELGLHLAQVGQSGTLPEWQADVAECCGQSSYLVFAICLALAAPLARLAQVETGCLHFWGPSNHDASIIESTMATVFGRARGDGEYQRCWHQAMSAPMQTAGGHSDLPLVLSDLNGLDADAKSGAQQAVDLVHLIAGGTLIERSDRPKWLLANGIPDIRLLIVSTGNLGLVGQTRARNGARYLSDALVIDIPISTRPTGVFDRLQTPSVEQQQKLIERLRKSSLSQYGTAGATFVQHVVRAVGNDELKFKKRLSRRMTEFFERVQVDVGDAYELQFAKRFALAYAAGTLASEYDLVPWHRDLIKRSIRRCYWRALDHRTGPRQAIKAAADALIRRLQGTGDIADLRDPSRPIDLKFAERAKALLLPHDDGSSLLAIRPEVFRSLVGPKASAQHVAAELERRGYLIPRPNGRRTRQVRVPGSGRRRDYYCLRGDVVDLDC
jgi:putative DNA primase/helicase